MPAALARWAVAALAVTPWAARSASIDAPLSLRTQGPVRELFLDATLADARVPERAEIDVRWAGANSWSTPTTVRRGDEAATIWTDEQADSLTASLRVPWSFAGLRLASAVEWRLTEHWGGWSDPLISWWHRNLLHVANYRREQYPQDEVHLHLGRAGTHGAISIDGPRFAPGDLVLRNQLAVAEGARGAGGRAPWAIALRLDLKAPTGRVADAGGSGGFDAALALLGTVELARWATLHAMAAGSALSRLPDDAGVQPGRLHATGEVSVAFHGESWALVVEDRVVSPLLEAGWTFPGTPLQRRPTSWAASFRPHNQLSFGVRWSELTLWISEDVTPGGGEVGQSGYYLSNAPDIVLGVAWRR